MFSSNFEFAIQEAVNQLPDKLASELSVQVVVKGVDFLLQPGQQKWDDVVPLKQGLAVLVRPDQHIIAVLDRNTGAAQVLEVLGGHLGW
ncbi:hypothetical protein PEBR_40492 [Penicillium brasilianum]|uniref:Uncharacterized protein n=1 Tax=Penicillium brasilianum TaxID=104259 RepID=A0A1S9RB74_PENBI|nr:hypothetical protein PEBR_40492 [Penicillium brasilianum]